MSSDALCILIPTWKRGLPLARFTTGLLKRFWPVHPPVFYCGSNGPTESWIPTEDRDQRDWMGLVLDACRHLAGRGYTQCYLILDDHPPIGPCHEEHLNATLPGLLEDLDGACIGLNGWGQGREIQGDILEPERYGLERLPESFPWRYSLHPTLWKTAALSTILEALTKTEEPERRTAWAFERRSGAFGTDGPAPGIPYRISGEAMISPRCRLRRPRLLALMRRLAGAGHYSFRLMHARERLRQWDEGMRFLYRYYGGPYPLFWAGLVTKGAPHDDMLRFLRFFGDRGIADEFEREVAPLL